MCLFNDRLFVLIILIPNVFIDHKYPLQSIQVTVGPFKLKKAVLKTIWFHTFHKQRQTRTCEINGAAQQQSCSDINYIYTTAETKQKTILAGWRAGGDVSFPLG